MEKSLNFIELITGRLAKTFSELNETIQEQIKRRQSERTHPTIPQLSNTYKSDFDKAASVQEKVAVKVQSQLQLLDREKPQKQQELEKVQKIEKSKPKKVLSCHRPRRVQNAFKFYLAEMKKKDSNLDQGQVTKKASKKWEIMSEEEKKNYVELEEKEKKRFQLELDHFYDMNPEQRDKDMSKKEKKQQKKRQKQQEKDDQSIKEKKDKKKGTSPLATPKKPSSQKKAQSDPQPKQKIEQTSKKESKQEQLLGQVPLQLLKEDREKGIEQFLNLGPDEASDSLDADI